MESETCRSFFLIKFPPSFKNSYSINILILTRQNNKYDHGFCTFFSNVLLSGLWKSFSIAYGVNIFLFDTPSFYNTNKRKLIRFFLNNVIYFIYCIVFIRVVKLLKRCFLLSCTHYRAICLLTCWII